MVLAEGVNDNMTQPTTTSENEYQPSIVNDRQQPQVEGLTTDDTATDKIKDDDIPNEGSEEISGEMQSIQL